jgi:hypothetical protein
MDGGLADLLNRNIDYVHGKGAYLVDQAELTDYRLRTFSRQGNGKAKKLVIPHGSSTVVQVAMITCL